jgi:hypothetical protein
MSTRMLHDMGYIGCNNKGLALGSEASFAIPREDGKSGWHW